MKKTTLILLTSVLLGYACQTEDFSPELPVTERAVTASANLRQGDVDAAGTCIKAVPLIAAQHTTVGKVQLYSNATHLYITYAVDAGWILKETHLYAGACEAMPVNKNGVPVPGQFPFKQQHAAGITTYTTSILLSELDVQCGGCLLAHAVVAKIDSKGKEGQQETAWGGDNAGDSRVNRWYYYTTYCASTSCEPGDAGLQLRTQTQESWGARLKRNTPAAYLYEHMNSAFSIGIVVGCERTLQLSTPANVTDFLPQSTALTVLQNSWENPDRGEVVSQFAGEVVALKLNVVFDLHDPAFGADALNLTDAVVANGGYKGWTVGEVLARAEAVLGGCGSPYSIWSLHDVVSRINESFVDGKVNTGYLKRP